MWVMNNIDLPDAYSPRPNLAGIPSMDDMIAHYEKVLSELDSAISSQKTLLQMTSQWMLVMPKKKLPRSLVKLRTAPR
jgi:hypothetical protein